MSTTIYEDALTRPDLFHWFGIDEAEFDDWLMALPLQVHPGLVSFWRRTGGGDLFDTETIFGPLVSEESDNVLKVNELYWNKGLSRNMFLFHSGVCLSVSLVDRRHRNRILSLKLGSFEIQHWFDTFNEWYKKTIRSEYAERYGLIAD